jgi:hypothetical protein
MTPNPTGTPNMTPNMTPTGTPNMTPTGTPNMTPTGTLTDDSIKNVFLKFILTHKDITFTDKWIYKFTIMSQLSFYIVPNIILYLIYMFINHFIKKEDKLGVTSYMIITTSITIGLYIYSNYLSPPELQYDYY